MGVGIRGEIAGITTRRAELDAAVQARDEALERLDSAEMAKRAVDGLRIRGRNAGAAMNPVGAWGLNGPAGQGPSFGSSAPGPMNVPLPPARPAGLSGEVPQQLKDLKDVLGGGGDALNPTIVPRVDTAGIEAVRPKAEEAKGAVEAVGAVTAKPTVDASSIEQATAAAQLLLSVLQSIPGAAGGAIAAAGRAGTAAGTLRGRSSASFSDGVTPGAGAE
ncbi:hypothetical protein MKK84_06965 [Methylobacterium sp. E-065]|uniref:hypothetical protein n=1 Tax=Methylobacterium sp. E-065 TaxID=2836583 RepID=UPI001FBA4B30|nr:hypothetical protein [Methylobacterium sp. E-065]MCJ2017164.1 hypothetical protein [Methylobacterium sp. E-065]